MELDLWSELEELNPSIADLTLFVHRLLRELQLTRGHSSRHSSRVDQIQRVHQQQLVRQQQLFAELQRENADLRSDNDKLRKYHQEHDDHHRQQLESAQQESAEALDVRQQLQYLAIETARSRSEVLRLHEAHQVRTQDIRDQHAVEISKLKRDKGEQQLAGRQQLEFVQHELAEAQSDLNIARAAAWDLNIAQVRLHSQSMRVDELETELETARRDISKMHQVHQEIRDEHEVDLRKLARDMGAHTALEVAAKDRCIHQLELRWLMSSEVKPAFAIIFEHGPLVALSKFSLLLYAADERAKPSSRQSWRHEVVAAKDARVLRVARRGAAGLRTGLTSWLRRTRTNRGWPQSYCAHVGWCVSLWNCPTSTPRFGCSLLG